MTWDVVRTPDDRFHDLPGYDYQPNYLEIDGVRIHYVAEGEGPPVVLFHGEPTWSFLYRKVIGPIAAAGYRVIAPDYPGFGRSDKPTAAAFYTYDRHVAFMAALLESLDVHNGTAVVQDWGGPIGLRLAVEHPDVLSRLVILNTGLFSGRTPPSEGFLRWRAFAEKNPDLPVGFIMGRSAHTEWPGAVIEAYEAPFPDQRYKMGAHRFPLIVPLDADSPDAVAMGKVRDALGDWSRPALVMFSTGDPVFPPSVGERFAALIPGAGELVPIENAGHFLQEDQGEQVAARIVEFLG